MLTRCVNHVANTAVCSVLQVFRECGMTTSTTSTTDTSTSITPTSVASGASDQVVVTSVPTVKELVAKQQPVLNVERTRYKADMQLPVSMAALDWRRQVKIDDVVEVIVTLKSGATAKLTGQVVSRSTIKGKYLGSDYEEIQYSIALVNSDTMRANNWDYRTEWAKLSSALLLVQKVDGSFATDKNGRTRCVTVPVTPMMIVGVDSSYRKLRESTRDRPSRGTRTQTSNQSTNLSRLIG